MRPDAAHTHLSLSCEHATDASPEESNKQSRRHVYTVVVAGVDARDAHAYRKQTEPPRGLPMGRA